jgi:hypothetical protein
MHSLELGLLALESVLLIATISLLVLSLKEGRGRDRLIMEVSNATKVLTRHEYFITVIDSMMDAKEEVLASITGRMPSGEDAKRTRELSYQIEKLTGKGVKVRYILPKFQDRLHVGCLYRLAGADVCYSPCVLSDDFRYTVVDSSVVVIGIPDSESSKVATGKGFKVPSSGLASILKENFMECKGRTSFNDFVEETMKQTGTSLEALTREIRVSPEDIRKALGK